MTRNRAATERESWGGELDLTSVVPLYYQLKEALKARLTAQAWRPGRAIPSENELAQAYGLSVGTVKKALAELVHEGVLTRRQGKGTFVARPDFRRSFFRFFRFGRGQGGEGLIPVSRVLSATVGPPSELVRERLRLAPGEPAILIQRVRAFEGLPLMVEDIHLPQARFAGLEKRDISLDLLYPIYDALFATPIVWAEEDLEPRIASPETAGHLGLAPGDPVIFIERTAYTYGDEPVEFRQSFGRGDRFRYHIELR